MAADADLPTHLGLHHHGDEPEVSMIIEMFNLKKKFMTNIID